MIWKFVVMAMVVGAVWALFTRKARGTRPRQGRDATLENRAETPLIKCAECGIYLPTGTRCDCRNRTDA